MISSGSGFPGLVTTKVKRLFPDKEIFLRSGDKVRFLHITTRAQLCATTVAASLAFGLVGLGVNAALDQAQLAQDRSELTQQQSIVARSMARVKRFGASVHDATADLDARQEYLEELVKSHFGDSLSDDVVGRDKDAAPAAKAANPGKTSSLRFDGPEGVRLRHIDFRQQAFAARLADAVGARIRNAEGALRSFGLNPNRLARQDRHAQGGPFIPAAHAEAILHGDIKRLTSALNRLDQLERTLVALPSGKPTAAPMLSSSFGYRSDPFNGHAAFHSGLDFPGRYGQPILAAAAGKVEFVGQKQGYGNVVDISHGNGIVTRYAHLSGFGVRAGQTVGKGQAIAKMGSTGRSTGTHLHFEVRVAGEAVNPRRFLEAKQDALKVQQLATRRFADAGYEG